MNKLLFIIITLVSFATSAQEYKYNKATINFYPSFNSSSSLVIDFKTSEMLFIINEEEQTNKFKISFEENKELRSVLTDLLNNNQPPIDTLTTEDGRIFLIDGRLSEDGMTIYIYLNDKKEPAIQLGNSYSESEADLLGKITELIRTRILNNDYVNIIENYLD